MPWLGAAESFWTIFRRIRNAFEIENTTFWFEIFDRAQTDGNRQTMLFNEYQNRLGNSDPIQWSHVMYLFSHQRLKWQQMQTLMTEKWRVYCLQRSFYDPLHHHTNVEKMNKS